MGFKFDYTMVPFKYMKATTQTKESLIDPNFTYK